MIEVCNYPDNCSNTAEDNMKCPPINLETYEFNLGQVNKLKCSNDNKCGACELCCLSSRICFVKSWLEKIGDHTKRRFMLGLLRRIHSVSLLNQLINLLQPLLNKDYTYARIRTNPGLDEDISSLSCDRALPKSAVEFYITSTWDWFTEVNYWTKANFAMNILQLCDANLLFVLYAQAKTLLVSEEQALSARSGSDYCEAASIDSSQYSLETVDHPELALLSAARLEYGKIAQNPFTGEDIVHWPVYETNESISESLSSIDPACMIIPTGSKAFSGVSRYKDFIRYLPVHLAKYILGLLDKASLSKALCVSKNWHSLAEEVKRENTVHKQLIEEVMLMQGAAAQCANPVFARDIDVPVPNLHPGTINVIPQNESDSQPPGGNNGWFETGYTGVSTRKVIMEERNVYCGAYNVMVLKDHADINRVIHTDGGKLIATGSKDRKVHLLDAVSGKEQGPLITGHAGSIRCVFLCEEKGVVFSGSYDTSIRMWSIETGQCLKIFRGHRDTVNSIILLGEVLASGGKDGSLKIWDVENGKCQMTFRHKSSVSTVALSKEWCIAGCESGKIRVWNLLNSNLIKTLCGHKGPVTSIKFDRWHIVSGSKDGYVHAWSSQGDHSKCLAALKHPKEVLCLEFMYLRVITGSADGRLRIWNLTNGQCCRIMRGNSRSDPILAIIICGDKITLNTSRNLLVLNFEKVEWDYSLESDNVPPLAQYGSFSDAPVRKQSYSYIRAKRMKVAGATNTKIVNHTGKVMDDTIMTNWLQSDYPAPQILHSSKPLSARSLESARLIQTSNLSARTFESMLMTGEVVDKQFENVKTSPSSRCQSPLNSAAPRSAPQTPRVQSSRSKLNPETLKSQSSTVKIDETSVHKMSNLDSQPPLTIERGVSWAFDKPILPSAKDISLSEMKSLLRSQIRMKAENIVPPDFIYLTVNNIQRSMSQTETSKNTKNNFTDELPHTNTNLKRPSSSPGKIDPRSKIPVEKLGQELLKTFPEEDEMSTSDLSDLKSSKSLKLKDNTKSKSVSPPEKEVYSVKCTSSPIKTKTVPSIHPKKVKSTLPKGRIIRPITAAVMQKVPVMSEFMNDSNQRPITAPSSTVSGLRRFPKKEIKSQSVESSMVPMLMYSQDVKKKIEEMKCRKAVNLEKIAHYPSAPQLGKVSPFNTPLRTHIKFELRTNEQEQDIVSVIKSNFKTKTSVNDKEDEKKKREKWLAKATSIPR